jgi:hypothetical protein
MNAKICKQCGELKPIEQYRKYYGGRKGHYNTCKLCEKINARAKYLRSKGESMDYDEERELSKIEKLYEAQRAAGLQPPGKSERSKPIVDSLDDMIAKYSQTTSNIIPISAKAIVDGDVEIIKPVPADLQLWLKCDLNEDPDYYLDEVYEELKTKYRPQLRIDTATMQPVYDDTYKKVLDEVLDRFYAYEDAYYDKED